MSLKIARWYNKQWIMNPFNLTCEQLKELILLTNNHSEWCDEFSVKYNYQYSWGHVFEEQSLRDEGQFHEIMVHYSCPSGYSKVKQGIWLKEHGYLFEV